MLTKLPITLLTSGELLTTADRLISAIEKPLTTVLKTRIDKAREASGQLAKALNKDRSSDFTPKLSEADQQRDNAYRSLRYAILSASYRPDEKLKSAAVELLDILKRHHSTLYDLGYIAQSAEMKSLRSELEQNKTTLEQAALQPLMTEMTEAMESFDSLYQEKLDVESGTNLPLVSETRAALAKQLNLLFGHLEIMLEDEQEGIAELVEKFNEVISDTMTTVRARQTRLENEKDEDELNNDLNTSL